MAVDISQFVFYRLERCDRSAKSVSFQGVFPGHVECCLCAACLLKGEHDGVKAAGDIVYFAVADEEAGGLLGAKPIVDNNWDAVRCDYVLTEGGFGADLGAQKFMDLVAPAAGLTPGALGQCVTSRVRRLNVSYASMAALLAVVCWTTIVLFVVVRSFPNLLIAVLTYPVRYLSFAFL